MKVPGSLCCILVILWIGKWLIPNKVQEYSNSTFLFCLPTAQVFLTISHRQLNEVPRVKYVVLSSLSYRKKKHFPRCRINDIHKKYSIRTYRFQSLWFITISDKHLSQLNQTFCSHFAVILFLSIVMERLGRILSHSIVCTLKRS